MYTHVPTNRANAWIGVEGGRGNGKGERHPQQFVKNAAAMHTASMHAHGATPNDFPVGLTPTLRYDI